MPAFLPWGAGRDMTVAMDWSIDHEESRGFGNKTPDKCSLFGTLKGRRKTLLKKLTKFLEDPRLLKWCVFNMPYGFGNENSPLPILAPLRLSLSSCTYWAPTVCQTPCRLPPPCLVLRILTVSLTYERRKAAAPRGGGTSPRSHSSYKQQCWNSSQTHTSLIHMCFPPCCTWVFPGSLPKSKV